MAKCVKYLLWINVKCQFRKTQTPHTVNEDFKSWNPRSFSFNMASIKSLVGRRIICLRSSSVSMVQVWYLPQQIYHRILQLNQHGTWQFPFTPSDVIHLVKSRAKDLEKYAKIMVNHCATSTLVIMNRILLIHDISFLDEWAGGCLPRVATAERQSPSPKPVGIR